MINIDSFGAQYCPLVNVNIHKMSHVAICRISSATVRTSKQTNSDISGKHCRCYKNLDWSECIICLEIITALNTCNSLPFCWSDNVLFSVWNVLWYFLKDQWNLIGIESFSCNPIKAIWIRLIYNSQFMAIRNGVPN